MEPITDEPDIVINAAELKALREAAAKVAAPAPSTSVERVRVAFDEKPFIRAFRRAVATFMFAFIGQLGSFNFLDVDIAVWKPAVAAGASAVINLIYRWSESALKEPAPPVDVPGGAVLPGK